MSGELKLFGTLLKEILITSMIKTMISPAPNNHHKK